MCAEACPLQTHQRPHAHTDGASPGWRPHERPWLFQPPCGSTCWKLEIVPRGEQHRVSENKAAPVSSWGVYNKATGNGRCLQGRLQEQQDGAPRASWSPPGGRQPPGRLWGQAFGMLQRAGPRGYAPTWVTTVPGVTTDPCPVLTVAGKWEDSQAAGVEGRCPCWVGSPGPPAATGAEGPHCSTRDEGPAQRAWVTVHVLLCPSQNPPLRGNRSRAGQGTEAWGREGWGR